MSKHKNNDQYSKTSQVKKVITSQNKLIKKIATRFQWHNIKNQKKYIKYMNSKLEIEISPFFKDKIFQGRSTIEVLQILNQIPFFRLLNKKGTVVNNLYNNQQITKVKIQYENADKILLITGISQYYLQHFMNQYQQTSYKNVKRISHNEYWSIVQLNTFESALILKKILRNKKINCDLDQNIKYRITKRKVRIVLLKQDFFTILFDVISEQAAHNFSETFNRSPYLNFQYTPLQFEGKQVRKNNQVEEIVFYDDGISEDLASKSSQLYGRLNQLSQIQVQTKNQAIQFEGKDFEKQVEIQTDGYTEIGEQVQEIGWQSYDKNQKYKIKDEKQQLQLQQPADLQNNVKQQQQDRKITPKIQQPYQQLISQQNMKNCQNNMEEQIPEKKQKYVQKYSQEQYSEKIVQKNNSKIEDPYPQNNKRQRFSINSLQMQDNNQIGVQVKQIHKTISQSKNYQLPSKKVQEKQQKINLSSQKIKRNRSLEPESNNIQINTYISNKQQFSNDGVIKRPKQLLTSPLANIHKMNSIEKNDSHSQDENNKESNANNQDADAQPKGIGKKGIIDFANSIENTRQLFQLSYGTMKKQQQEYLRKIGRKQLQIPQYIKKPSDRVIFKHKFFEQLIKYGGKLKKGDKY